MPSSRRQRRNFWVLSIAGCSALFVAALFLVKDWHLVLAEYHSYRLDRAETYEEAQPWLDLLFADAGSPGASDVFLSKLSAGRQHLTCWFFQRVFFEGPSDGKPLLLAFGARLERDEELLKSWSHYVRWNLGDGLWSALDAMSPSLDAQGSQVFPCGL